MKRLFLGLFLLAQAILDAKTGYVSLPLLLLQTLAGIFTGTCAHGSDILSVGRFFPGIVLLAASFFTKEGIGQGDAWLFMALGIYLTAEQQVLLLFASLLSADVWIILLKWLRHGENQREIPFVPFVLAAYVGGCCYGWF